MDKSDIKLYKDIEEQNSIYVNKTKKIMIFFQKGDKINYKLYTSKEVPITKDTVLMVYVYVYDGDIKDDETKESIISEYRNVIKSIKEKTDFNISMKFHLYRADKKTQIPFKIPKTIRDNDNTIIVVKYHIDTSLPFDMEDWED